MHAVAQHRSPDQVEEVRAFVRELYARSEYPTQEDFARAAGVHPVSLSNWMSVTADRPRVPDSYNLMRLLVAAGVLERGGALRLPVADAGDDVVKQLLERPESLTPETIPWIRQYIDAERAVGHRALRLADALERELEDLGGNTASG